MVFVGADDFGYSNWAEGMAYEEPRLRGDLQRFRDAQEEQYDAALAEVEAGRKESHWIWYIIPQLRGLGRSQMSDYYGVSGLDEAQAYLRDEGLRGRLEAVFQAFLDTGKDVEAVFGFDAVKVRASATLFALADPGNPLFRKVLDEAFGGQECPATNDLLAQPVE